MGSEGVRGRKPSATGLLGRECVDQVTHDTVVEAVSDEHDRELTEQLGNEPRCPTLGKIRAAEVRRGKHKMGTIDATGHVAVQMYE